MIYMRTQRQETRYDSITIQFLVHTCQSLAKDPQFHGYSFVVVMLAAPLAELQQAVTDSRKTCEQSGS